MFIKIDFESDEPIYLQLKNRIIEGIAAGLLRPGDSLPSVRQMGADLGINLHTVNKTYSVLKDGGYIVIHKRQGVLINTRERMEDAAFADPLAQMLLPIIAESVCKGIRSDEFTGICRKIFTSLEGGKSDE